MTERRRHVPLRRCVTCRRSLPKAHLERLLRGDDGWRHDVGGRGGGRGTWLCHACLHALDERTTRRNLARAFRQEAEPLLALLRTLEVGAEAAAAATAHAGDADGTPDGRPAAATAPTAPTPHDARHGGTHG